MEDSSPSRPNADACIDPVALDLALRILSTLVSIVGLVNEIDISKWRARRAKKQLRELRHDVMQLHNCLDDLILTVDKYIGPEEPGDSEQMRILASRLSISGTMMRLKEREYLGWLDLNNRIDQISARIYGVIRKIRAAALDMSNLYIRELNLGIVRPFDSLLHRMNELPFADFLTELRSSIQRLQEFLDHSADTPLRQDNKH